MGFVISDISKIWSDGIVPYEIIDADFPFETQERENVEKAIEKWNETSIKLIQRTNQRNYIIFRNTNNVNDTCGSAVGMLGAGPQYISCSGQNINVVVHEIGHAIGLYHEHQRPDRNKHIEVHYGCILAGFRSQFNIREDGKMVGEYDYSSIMHYSSKTLLDKEKKDCTVTISRRTAGTRIPRGYGVLKIPDIEAMNALYQLSIKELVPIDDDRGLMIAFCNGVVMKSLVGFNFGGGGFTKRVYEGFQTVVKMMPFKSGVVTAFSGGGVYFSPDGQSLTSQRIYGGRQRVVAMIPYKDGIVTAFSGGGVYLSIDGNNLASRRVYSGPQTVVAIIPYKEGIITAFNGGAAYFSPNGQNLTSQRVYSGRRTIEFMMPYKDGVITALSGGSVYYSPDGRNLTFQRVYSGSQTIKAMIPYNEGVITAFSSGWAYFSHNGQQLAARRVYSGRQNVLKMVPYKGGVLTIFSGKGVYYSSNGRQLASKRVYPNQ